MKSSEGCCRTFLAPSSLSLVAETCPCRRRAQRRARGETGAQHGHTEDGTYHSDLLTFGGMPELRHHHQEGVRGLEKRDTRTADDDTMAWREGRDRVEHGTHLSAARQSQASLNGCQTLQRAGERAGARREGQDGGEDVWKVRTVFARRAKCGMAD